LVEIRLCTINSRAQVNIEHKLKVYRGLALLVLDMFTAECGSYYRLCSVAGLLGHSY